MQASRRDGRASERLPGCGTLLVVGTGGQHGGEPVDPRTGDPAVEDLVTWLRGQNHECCALYPRCDPHCFAQMGELAGLGTVSPVLGRLMHPEFGLWVNIRAVVLIAGEPFGFSPPPLTDFDPCATCSMPCVEACPAGVYEPHGHPEPERCGQHLHRGGCTHGCGALLACPIGKEHRDTPERATVRVSNLAAAMRKAYGLGLWGLLPQVIRRWL